MTIRLRQFRWLAVAISVFALCSCIGRQPVRPGGDLGTVAAADRLSPHVVVRDDVSPETPLEWRAGETVTVFPTINGLDIGPFVLDTGANGMLITSDAAERAGLESIGSTRLQDGSRTTVYRSDSFHLGPLELGGTTYAGADFPFAWLSFGQTVHGICGYDIFASAVVEMDIAGGVLRMYDPDRYVLTEGRWEELVLAADLPHVRGTYEGGHEGLFLLDLGFAETVWFFEHVVEAQDLLAGRETRKRRILNFGATTRVRYGGLAWFKIGGHRFENTTADYSVSEMKVYPGPPEVAGIVGMKILAEFRIVFDYSNERVAFIREDDG